MTAGSLSLSGTSPNLQTGSKLIGPLTMSGSTAIGQISTIIVTSSANSITVPTTYVTAVALVPNGTGMIAVGSSSAGPFGIPAGTNSSFIVLAFSSTPPTSFNIFASSGGGTLEATWV